MTLTSDLAFVRDLTATQEHFLKKFLLEEQLTQELHHLSEPHCLQHLGPPFSVGDGSGPQLPLLRFFFSQFVATFPLVANNTDEDQIVFWRDTVEPFVDSFNGKNMSEGVERQALVTKRHQVNHKMLSSLLLFYNSMLMSERELEYLDADHLKASDQGKFEKLSKGPTMKAPGLEDFQKQSSLDDYAQMKFVNDLNLNIVAVDVEVAVEEEKLWSAFRMFTAGTTGQLNYFFVIQVTRRTKQEKSYVYKLHFISRSYLEFKELESQLKKKYPGLMTTEIRLLPHKLKNDDGIVGEKLVSSDDALVATSSTTLTRNGRPVKFHREKLRLALRGYLHILLAKPEIAHCDVFTQFINSNTFHHLNPTQQNDYLQRMELERNRLETQRQFQNHTAQAIHALTKDFDNFKSQLIMEPHQLTTLFEELSHTDDPEKVSPLLRTFVEWCKLEVAATLYQVFLTQDNSSDWLHKCRKFHRLFPYNVCYGILKYTNPVRIMSRMVDVLLVNMPSFGSEKKVNNLLAMTFVTLLDEDLSDYEKERTKLLELAPLSQPEYQVFVERIYNYVQNKEFSVSDSIKEEAVSSGENLLLTILSTDQLLPKLTSKNKAALQEVQRAYSAYDSLDNHKQVEQTKAFVNLRQLWQLEVRARDKEVLKQLWQEPELTRLIKQFLTVFFQPMMSVMKKCDVHLVFRDWQHFMNDLMDELTKLDLGDLFYMTSVEMFNRFKSLLDKHEGALWRFMHNLYVKDDLRIFLGIVAWFEKFLVILRLKYLDPMRVTLPVAQMTPAAPVDAAKFVSQLDNRIHLVVEKRRLLKEYLEQAATNAGDGIDPENVQDGAAVSPQQAIDSEWNRLNDGFFDVDGSGFGVGAGDVEDFNLGHMHGKTLDTIDANDSHRAILQEVAKLDQQLQLASRGGELDKLGVPVQNHLHKLLDNWDHVSNGAPS